MEYNIKHEKLLTKRLKSSTIVNCNENKKLIEVINKMKDNKVYLTDEGFLELEEELNELKNVKRPEVIKALKEARALGDLSENADYDAARAEQAQVEGRIQELEKIMENVHIIEKGETDKVSLGTTVKIKYVDDDEIEEYRIEKVIITYKDRLSRIGFDLFERIFSKYGTKIEFFCKLVVYYF